MTNILGLLKRVRDGVRSCLQVTPADAEVDTADNMWELRGKNWSQRNREQPTEVCGKTTSNNYMDWGVVFTLSRQGIWLELGVLLLTSFWFLHCDHRTFKGQVFSPKLLNVYFFYVDNGNTMYLLLRGPNMVLTVFSSKNFCAFQGLEIFIVVWQIYDGLSIQVNNRSTNSGDHS